MNAFRKQSCVSCRYWSDQQARATDKGEIHAICLNVKSNLYGTYTPGGQGCEEYHMGKPIDEPREVRRKKKVAA